MKFASIWFVVLVSLACTRQVLANAIEFSTSLEFSGGMSPAGPAPWMTATIDDFGSQGSVKLTLANSNLVGDEFVSEWSFNLDPSLDPKQLKFKDLVTTGSLTSPTIEIAQNGLKADGNGKYSFRFDFSTDGKAESRFGAGESLSITTYGISTLTANSFNFLSKPTGGHGPFVTAAHVQGICGSNGTGSGWVTVPEPSSLVLGVLGLLGLACAGRRRQT